MDAPNRKFALAGNLEELKAKGRLATIAGASSHSTIAARTWFPTRARQRRRTITPPSRRCAIAEQPPRGDFGRATVKHVTLGSAPVCDYGAATPQEVKP
jgi:hypothetical protein